MSFGDLPLISTKYEKHTCRPDCRCPEANKNAKGDSQDKRLENWDRWLGKRKEIHQKIEKRTKRPANQSIMNTFEDKRPIEERKNILQYAKIPHLFDRWRGNPAFWKMPTSLARYCCCEPEKYFATLTKPEKCEIPEIEYIKVPNKIKTEKEAHCDRKVKNWCSSTYCKNKFQTEEVKDIEPYVPSLSDLIVVGNGIYKEPEILFERDSNQSPVSTEYTTSEEVTASPCFLIINDMRLHANAEGLRTTTLFLEGIKCSGVETTYLFIENRSNRCLRFSFKRHEQTKTLTKIVPTACDKQKFFYNKNIHVIQPGEKLNFPFWFTTDICGPFTDTFAMDLTPDFWNGNLKIVVTLHAEASKKNLNEQLAEIVERIDNQIRARVINEFLEDILKKIPRKKSEIRVYTYDKAAIFEAVNSVYDPMQFRPKYLYDRVVVHELERFYKNVRMDHHPEEWDYKLDTLRTVTKDRQNFETETVLEENLKDITTKIEESKVKRDELEAKALSFWKDEEGGKKKKGKKGKGKGSDKSKKSSKPKKSSKGSKDSKKSKKGKKGKKDKGGKEVIEEPQREPLPKTLCDELEDIIAKLKAPSTWKKEHKHRIQLCYTLFCAYIDRICEDVLDLEHKFYIERLLPKVRKMEHVEKDRIYDEKLESSGMEAARFMERVGGFGDQPAPPWTYEIPLEEHEQRFKAYHKKETKDKGKKKGKKGKQDKKSKSTKSKDKSKSSKDKSKGSKGKKEKKKPKSKTSITSEKIEEKLDDKVSTPDEEVFIPFEVFEHYENNIYIIFYSNLQHFIDDMVAVFELQPKPEIPPNVLQRIQHSQFDQLHEDTGFQVQIIDLKQKISDALKWEDQDDVVILESPIKLVPIEKPDIGQRTSSVWTLLKAYFPKKIPSKPLDECEEEIYAVPTKMYPPETRDQSTSITPEEIITERNLQTSICDSDTANMVEEINIDVTTCICEELPLDPEVKRISSFYDSTCAFDQVSSKSEDDDSCK